MSDVVFDVYQGKFSEELANFVGSRYFDCGRMSFDSLEEVVADILEEDARFAEASTVVVARNREGEVVGTARALVKNELWPGALPIEGSFGHEMEFCDGGRVIEVGRLASIAGSGFALTVGMLLQLFVKLSPTPDRDVVVACLDESLCERLLEFGWPIERLGPGCFYLGSVTVPVRVSLSGWLEVARKSIGVIG